MATLEELKTKYCSALKTIEEQGVKVQNFHIQDNKLFIKGAAPTKRQRDTCGRPSSTWTRPSGPDG